MPAAVTSTQLIVLRGNSGSGKTSTARKIRERYGRGIAWIEQDYLRRIVLHEPDVPDGANIGLIALTVRHALDHGFHVVLEGILDAKRYGDMLRSLHDSYRGGAWFYYFDTPFEETIRRHATRPQSARFSPDDMRAWYTERDLLPFVDESLVTEESTLEQAVGEIMTNAGLLGHQP